MDITATEERKKKAALDILNERDHQAAGDWSEEHDDGKSSNDWVALLAKWVGKAVMEPFDRDSFRRCMVVVGALAVAAIEWCDRWAEADREVE